MPLLYLSFLFIILIVILQLGIFSIVLAKLGLSPDSAVLLLSCTLVGSLINLRLFTLDSTFELIPENYKIPHLLFKPTQAVP